MSFEDRLRAAIHRAETVMPHSAVSWDLTIRKARRQRVTNGVLAGAGLAAIVGLAVMMGPTSLDRDGRGGTARFGVASIGNEACSAAGMELRDQSGLSRAVALLRRRIGEAAAACSYETLDFYSLVGDETFTYSVAKDPAHRPGVVARYWETLERSGEAPLRNMMLVFNLPYCEMEAKDHKGVRRHTYVWPSVQCPGATQRDWDALAPTFPSDQVAEWERYGQYLGYRAMVTEEGDWLHFVAGD